MSEYSQRVRERFVWQWSLAAPTVERVFVVDAPLPCIRLAKTFDPGHGQAQERLMLCPLTATCYHSLNSLFPLNEYGMAAEELAVPRGMGVAIARAADGMVTTPWRQRVLDWWRARLLEAGGYDA